MSQTIEERLATYVGSGEFPKEKSKILSDLMDWRLGGHGRGGRVGSVELAQLDAQRSEVKSACNAFVRSRWDDRELAIRTINDFFLTFSSRWQSGTNCSDRFCDFEQCYSDRASLFARLAKYLQSGERTREEMGREFGVSVQALSSVLSDLQDGVNVLGKHIRIAPLRRGSNTYDPSLHPVFLTLNLTEAHALTVELKRVFGEGGPEAGSPFAEAFLNIADDAHGQLTDYARESVDRNAAKAGVRFHRVADYRQEKTSECAFFIKSQELCSIEHHDLEGPVRGRFAYVGGPSERGFFGFQAEDGRELRLSWSGFIRVTGESSTWG